MEVPKQVDVLSEKDLWNYIVNRYVYIYIFIYISVKVTYKINLITFSFKKNSKRDIDSPCMMLFFLN